MTNKSTDNCKMALTVAVQRASNLPNVERFGKSDPYAVVAFRGRPTPCPRPRLIHTVDRSRDLCSNASFSFRLRLGQECKTAHVKGSLEPQWKEVFEFTLDEPNHLTSADLLEVTLYDHERTGKHR